MIEVFVILCFLYNRYLLFGDFLRLVSALKIVRFMLCPYRASFVTPSFTQGVAIGLDMFKPFQGIFRGYV